MLSFLAPGYLFAALAAATGLVAAHFIVRRQPRSMLLPTARFVPDAPVLSTGWARVPSDLIPLLLRVLCVLLAGVALAGPIMLRRAGGTARVILVDRSGAVADTSELSDSVAAVRAPLDVVIGYGSRTREKSMDLPAADVRLNRASLSAGLVAATRAASRFRAVADSIELVIVSPFTAGQLDAATARLRGEWPGRARLVRVAAAAGSATPVAPTLVAAAEDPLSVALALTRDGRGAEARIVRRELTADDSLWVNATRGRVLVHWPAASAPAGFIARRDSSVAAGVVGRGPVLVAPLERRWQYAPGMDGDAVAWWIDGEVAAAESPLGEGCVRSVAVPVSGGGDFVLRPEFHALLSELVQPCGGAARLLPIPAGTLALLRGTGGLAPAGAFAPPRLEASPLTKWLLLASLAAALLELLARSSRASRAPATSRNHDESVPTPKAA